MSGIYGTVKPANITSGDVEIFYSYRATRSSSNDTVFTKLDSRCLRSTEVSGATTPDSKLTGLYNLRLPLDIFGTKGFYTIYIRPKEIEASIVDVGTLATYSSVRGVIFNVSDLSSFAYANALAGYRIEYFGNSSRSENTVLITSSNRCEGMNSVITSDGQTHYRFTDTGGLIFCTVTPSLPSSFKPNFAPAIGEIGQKVVIVNTKFDPIMMEVEMVDHDIETISNMLEGDQVRDIDHGLITTMNSDGEIYMQAEYKSIKDTLGHPAYEIKQKKNDVDFTQDIDSILGETIEG